MRSWRLWLGGVALVAVATRAAALLASAGYRPLVDDLSYLRVARWLLLSGHYPLDRVPGVGAVPSAYRPPGWPALLAGTWSLTGVDVGAGRLVLLALGVAACLLGALIARRVGGDRAGVIAGLLLAVDPLLIAASSSLESEALFTALLLGAVLAALRSRDEGRRRWAVAAGALIGAAALTRTNGLALIPVVAWLAVPSPAAARRAWPAAALAVVTAVLVVAPWTVRNAVELHRFVPVSTETGNTLAGTYNPVSEREDARWLLPERAGAYRSIYRHWPDSPQRDSLLQDAVLHWTLRHPAYPLAVVGWNSARLLGFDGPGWAAWSLRTMSLGTGLAVPVWLMTLALTLLAALALARRRARVGRLGVVALSLLLTTVPFTGEMRLGIPLQALLAVIGATAVAERCGPPQGAKNGVET